jgi:hypothetical protein
MNMEARIENEAKFDAFEASRTKFDSIVVLMLSAEMAKAKHSEIEAQLDVNGRELMRTLLQDHLKLRAKGEPRRLSVVGSEKTERREVVSTERELKTIFGEVKVERLAYRAPRKGVCNLMPLDRDLNLPREVFSFGLQKRAAIEIAKSSFEESQESIRERCGITIGKKQLEDMAVGMAKDFDEYYGIRSKQTQEGMDKIFGHEDTIHTPAGLDRSKFLVITTDGKGIAVIEKDLREGTRKAAQKRKEQLQKTEPFGEGKEPKLYRRRMAQVCSVYTIEAFCRTPEDIIRELKHLKPVGNDERIRPKPEYKRVWASVEHDAEIAVDQAFAEALRRDPKQELQWVVVVDGSAEQIRIIQRCQKRYQVKFKLVLDYIHVAQYVWKAAHVFNKRGSIEARKWVDERLLEILRGNASAVAAGIRRSATLQKIPGKKREPVDGCCDYILGHVNMMRYGDYLKTGLPIGSGVIEGACRHLIIDRFDLSGATWTVQHAEAILKLRALRCSGDFEEYWKFHEQEEFRRNHLAKY